MGGIGFIPNALMWAQLHLLGGHRRLISIGVVYAGVIVVATLGLHRLDLGGTTSFYDVALTVLTFVQLGVLVLGGSNAVFRALARDMTSNMLESHRLSPMGGAQVIIGYLFGATLQMLLIFAINLVAGLVFIRLGAVAGKQWLAGNLYLLAVAPLAWTATLMFGIGRKKPINPGAIMFVIFMLAAPLLSLPGIGIVTGIYAGFTAYELMSGSLTIPRQTAYGLAIATVLLTCVYAHAAKCKFRRPDLPAFGPVRGLTCTAIFAAVTAGGFLVLINSDLRGIGFFDPTDPTSVGLTGLLSMATLMVAGLIPIGSVAHARVRIARGGRRVYLGDGMRRGVAPTLCTLLVLIFVAAYAWAAQSRDELPNLTRSAILYTALGVFLMFLAMDGLFTFAWVGHRRAARYVLLYLVIVGALPVIAGQGFAEYRAAYVMHDPTWADRLPFFTGISPVGTAVPALGLGILDVRLGLAIHAVIAAALWWTGYRTIRSLIATRRAEGVTP